MLDSTSMVKFRNRIGAEGMKRIEAVLLQAWSGMGLVKARRVAVDTTSQPKNIAYPTDADLLHRIKEKIVRQIERVREEVTLRKPFRTFSRTGKRILLGIKKFHRKNPEARQKAIGKLKEITAHVVKQAAGVANTLYSRGHRESGRQLNRLVALGKRIISQTEEVLRGTNPANRLYSLHELDVAAIKKGKSFPSCEFGSLVSLAKNDDGLILSHQEYQQNVADVKTLGRVITGIKRNTGQCPDDITADRGFDQSLTKQENCRRRWEQSGQQRALVPKSAQAADQNRAGHRSPQMRPPDEPLPIPRKSRRYGQRSLGDARLEHEKDRPTGYGKGRKVEQQEPSRDCMTGYPARVPRAHPSFFSCQRTELLQTSDNPVFQEELNS